MGRRGERSDARIRCASHVVARLRFSQRVSRGRGAEILRCLLLSVLLFAAFASSTAYASNYVYDVNGRLIAVTDTSGNTVVYSYDAVGNILSIQKLTAGQLALFTFNPAQGVMNTVVTLQGNGFSTTPGNNIVKFNGTAATVTSATNNQLIVMVPSGATTGPVSVTVGSKSNTVTSTINFVVIQSPTISSFSPSLGDVGTAVTVNGTNFDPVMGKTEAGIAGFLMPISAISNTQLTFSISPDAGSGQVQVITPYGQASSSQDFIVAPTAIGAANITASAQLTGGGSAATLNVTTSSKYGVFVFNATQGQYLSVQLSSLSTTPSGGSVNYSAYDSHNVQIASGSVSASNMSIHLPVIAATGSYLVAFSDAGGTFKLTAELEVNATLKDNGASLSVSTTAAAQSKRLVFTGTTGQNLGLGITNLVYTDPSGNAPQITVYKPDGSYWFYVNCYGPGCTVGLTDLPQTGNYQIVITPPNLNTTMSFTATLSPDVTATLTQSSPYSLNLADAGQIGLLTFTPAAGQTLATLQVSGVTVASGDTAYIYIYAPGGWPSGSPVASTTTTGGNYTFNLTNLTAGTYTVQIWTHQAGTATMMLELLPAVTGTLTDNGTGSNFSTLAPSQNVYLTFSGQAGQNLGLGITNLVYTNPSGYAPSVTVYKPDGTYWLNVDCYGPGCTIGLADLPQTGTYQIVIQPPGPTTMSFTATLSPDVTATLTQGSPYSLNLADAGQIGLLTFTPAAGQTLATLQVSGVTVASGDTAYIYIYGPGGWPSGSPVASTTTTGGNYTFNLTNLTAGTYTVYIWTHQAGTATMTVTLASGVTGVVATNGTGSSFSTTIPGQNAYFTFAATAGQNLGMAITNQTFSVSGTSAIVNVYKPDGTPLTAAVCNPCTMGLSNLPQTGTYSVIVAPNNAQATMSFTATISPDVPGISTLLSPNVPYALNLQYPGQEGLMGFTATAGQTVALEVSGIATSPTNNYVSVNVYAPGEFPGGPALATANTTTGTTINLPNLAAGTYTVWIWPFNGATATMTVEVTP